MEVGLLKKNGKGNNVYNEQNGIKNVQTTQNPVSCFPRLSLTLAQTLFSFVDSSVVRTSIFIEGPPRDMEADGD